jgi:hypothetical protein
MIDTDKYEGHTEGEWRVDDKVGLVIKHGEGTHDYVDMENKANAQLMADAPLLLAEVKRLREGMNDMLYRLEMEERDAGHAEQELEQWIDTWKHWLKEMIG